MAHFQEPLNGLPVVLIGPAGPGLPGGGAGTSEAPTPSGFEQVQVYIVTFKLPVAPQLGGPMVGHCHAIGHGGAATGAA